MAGVAFEALGLAGLLDAVNKYPAGSTDFALAVACNADSCSGEDCVQLTEREFSVCRLICSSSEPVSFGKLKKSTAFHQEIVSRIVRRLMIHGLVKRTDAGYLGQCGQ